mmetsp:Transcript_34072/g.55544  ORF Transcript_34072/g.55544 Transcript_34072/m.55544 type:complete len:284 (-) Transcript_34072:134-985(-)|eukprot:CAMPEP_0202695372 /NCGR_PEP_ID=MMETSP1385-20130828/8980_1 /ASSEMBLY_ACC=CAM_ASM_000861 /TAXON_ID=933848 /ORGANISM="Elphidium margaritaceum" /LENGTH=283 /DNA_ID=CAMNT_0049351385 /DNA_START=78 /DNA_END=929 /DNA_ORIENTATION=-
METLEIINDIEDFHLHVFLVLAGAAALTIYSYWSCNINQQNSGAAVTSNLVAIAKYINWLVNYLSTSVPPGGKIMKMKHVINFQKGSTFFFVALLMVYFSNYNETAYIYLALHGIYGFMWLLKERIFPDKNWERDITAVSAVLCFATVLAPYWAAPYLIIRDRIGASYPRLAFCVMLHTTGVVMMMAADTQKFFELRAGKKLINDGWFRFSRNLNYLGEMMIYATYAVLGTSMIPYFILSYVWLLIFVPNMLVKDLSIAVKPGGAAYIRNSSLLVPRPADFFE